MTVFLLSPRDAVMSTKPEDVETDPRFPSGRWVGFWIQRHSPPGRHQTELTLTFSQGTLHGDGRDWVGTYSVRGRYNLADGRCHWTKAYQGKHSVAYDGFNEGKGIWGTWAITASEWSIEVHGGFHIWPEGMLDPTGSHLTEKAELPAPHEEVVAPAEPVAAPAV
jgi:hypothetical protein